MDKCGVYVLHNKVNGKVYVGQSIHINRRFSEHKKSAKRGDKSYLYASMRKYGQDAFSCEVAEECAPEILDEREGHWMAVYDCRNPEKGYNFMPHGQRGRVMNTEMRLLLSEKSRGYRHTPEAIEKMRVASTGRFCSEETKAKISAANKGRKVSEASAQKTGAALRERWDKMTPDEKIAYVEKRTGWSQPEHVREQVSERFKGVPKSEAQRAKMSAASKNRNPEGEAVRLEALRVANKLRWDTYRLKKQEALCSS